jgi:hypothetical protein
LVHKEIKNRKDKKTENQDSQKNGQHNHLTQRNRPDYFFFWLITTCIMTISAIFEVMLKWLDKPVNFLEYKTMGSLTHVGKLQRFIHQYLGSHLQEKFTMLLRQFPKQQEIFNNSWYNTPKSRANYLRYIYI